MRYHPLRRLNILLFVLAIVVAPVWFQARPVKAQTTPFLYRPYYGPFDGLGFTARFDHKYPDYGATDDGHSNTYFVRHTGLAATEYCDQEHPLNSALCYSGHDGHDFPLVYAPAVASASGQISMAGWHNSDHGIWQGLVVRINHNNNFYTQYGHLSMVRYQTGKNVGRWQIGTTGDTGNSTGPHLHFSVFRTTPNNGLKAIDPYGWSGDYTDPWLEEVGAQSEYLWVDDPLQSPPSYSGTTYVDDGSGAYGNYCAGGTLYWWTVNNVGYNNDLRYTFSNGTTLNCWAKFSPSLPNSGYHEIEAYIPYWDVDNRSHAARYVIAYNGGTNTVVVDQHAPDENVWIGLGRYDFLDNRPLQNFVSVVDSSYIGSYTDPTYKKVLVDALRWNKAN